MPSNVSVDGEVVARRCDDVHVNALIAQRDRQLEHERTGGVARLARERMSEK
jgi:hypothetical protein